uniref:peptidyl-tRNA hydrolase n=1 Tax=Saccoglossus kowalevskii TaxID=10224 RepID=A0ABM0GTQ0_SACKO|nr:PREDICTED: putative peptidyl-tRNA hydrolase PTRHD1-like [Saccoglossus kowalevskii]
MMAASMVQYVVVRGDLIKTLKWPTGAVITQVSLPNSIVYAPFNDTCRYLEGHKHGVGDLFIILLQAKDEESIQKLAEKLQEDKIDHKLWIEQPENIPTCLAAKPYPKEEIQKYFKKFKLFK